MNIKKNRIISIIIITIIYILSTIIGILVYIKLPYNFWLNLLISDIVATIVVFIFSLIFKNASVYDPYWSVQPIVIIVAYATVTQLTLVRTQLVTVICLWGIRLTANWVYTFYGLKYQDWRYSMLHDTTGRYYLIINFIGIHLVPTLIVYACVLPAVFVFKYDASWNILSTIFCILSLCAMIMQGIADLQMHKFRRKKEEGLIHEGLWKYSRHPNYLGEILMWWGIAFSVIVIMPKYWYLCVGALANTLLFLFVSIPMADKRQSKKIGFEEYKKETRMLLPIPKKRVYKSGIKKEKNNKEKVLIKK